METTELVLETRADHVTDVTGQVAQFCRDRGDGLMHVSRPTRPRGSR